MRDIAKEYAEKRAWQRKSARQLREIIERDKASGNKAARQACSVSSVCSVVKAGTTEGTENTEVGEA